MRAIFVDHGLMRKDEAEEVRNNFHRLGIPIETVNASELFLGRLAGVGDPEKKRDMGDAYCYGIYRDTHRAAAAFLREIAPRYPEAQAQLKAAAAHFEAEADALKGAEKLLWWGSPAGPDAARNEQAVKVLQKARDEYAAGIADIENALAQIGDEQ